MYAHEHAQKAANLIKTVEDKFMEQGYVDETLFFRVQVAQVHATLASGNWSTG